MLRAGLTKNEDFDLTMALSPYHPWLHRVAVLTAGVSLLPIVMGALVTTTDAGMAFRDWPTSDGHGMLTYPWWQSVGDKFLEHGHRLAGILIGIASIALCVCCTLLDGRTWVKMLGAVVLLAVLGQGLLGGQRVLLDARGLAFIHGSFAAVVFGLMAALVVVTSRNWHVTAAQAPPMQGGVQGRRPAPNSYTRRLRAVSIAAVVCLFVQYVLGGFVRHRGTALYEHLGFAFVAALLALAAAMLAMAAGVRWFQAPALCLAGLTIVQLGLGAGAWITRFGFGDYVAVYRSPLQISMRTGHVLTGMLLLATSVVLMMRVLRVAWLEAHSPDTAAGTPSVPFGSWVMPGGAG